MTDTDLEGLLGTVVMGGLAIKMTQSMFGNNTKDKKRKKKLTSSKQYFNSPW
jgi:hypothetical protein